MRTKSIWGAFRMFYFLNERYKIQIKFYKYCSWSSLTTPITYRDLPYEFFNSGNFLRPFRFVFRISVSGPFLYGRAAKAAPQTV